MFVCSAVYIIYIICICAGARVRGMVKYAKDWRMVGVGGAGSSGYGRNKVQKQHCSLAIASVYYMWKFYNIPDCRNDLLLNAFWYFSYTHCPSVGIWLMRLRDYVYISITYLYIYIYMVYLWLALFYIYLYNRLMTI